MSKISDNLIILELANNHMGSVDHGKHIISEFSSLITKFPLFNFAFKLQYRDLDTFIRPDYRGRMDVKHVKRFEETRLSRTEQEELIAHMKRCGFLTMCTPFDNASVEWILEDGFDLIKVASCSFGDWPLLEDIAASGLPVVASTGGATLQTIDDVISFFQNRDLDFVIQHCVGEYPTPYERMNLNQIDYLKERHSDVRFGFSTHEDPSDTRLVQMAISKGAISLEKHVGVPTEDWPLNAYSSNLSQTLEWLNAAESALLACGTSGQRYEPSETERSSLLALQRGAFPKCDIEAGEILTKENIYFAFPPDNAQVTAADFSKYSKISVKKKCLWDQPILKNEVQIDNGKDQLLLFAKKVVDLITEARVVVPKKFDLEISHHYGIDRFEEVGLSMITLVNREYCKKILVCLPNQLHPEQYHLEKEETFNILYGSLELKIDGETKILNVGDLVTITPNQRHEFVSSTGAVIEEISSTHFKSDSYYTDKTIELNPSRKSFVKWVRSDDF